MCDQNHIKKFFVFEKNNCQEFKLINKNNIVF